jgi:hypothetical protein
MSLGLSRHIAPASGLTKVKWYDRKTPCLILNIRNQYVDYLSGMLLNLKDFSGHVAESRVEFHEGPRIGKRCTHLRRQRGIMNSRFSVKQYVEKMIPNDGGS